METYPFHAHHDEAFKFRRGQYFWHTRAAIGHATALAVARRAVRGSPNTPFVVPAPAPTLRTTCCTRLRLRWLSE